MADWLESVWPYVASAGAFTLAAIAAGHAVIHRRDSRAALLWVGLVFLAPVVGAVLYFLLGINRVRRKAAVLRAEMPRVLVEPRASPVRDALGAKLDPRRGHLDGLRKLVERVVVRPLVPGNRIDPLYCGDEAYPAMLDAIDAARRSISLATYIFDADRVGRQFVDRLAAAVARGVEVRVLVDDAGAHYSLPSISGSLRRRRIPHARFHSRPWFLPTSTLNLRNHRKICVVDGGIGFTGGMNIRRSHVLAEAVRRPVRDTHFRITGPVVASLQEVFVEDWLFTTGERLEGSTWFPPLEPAGASPARAIEDGPDEDLDKLHTCLLGAISTARESIRIVTPYFLPDQAIVSALSVAALRGVEVDILIPERVNVPLVQWAMRATLWQVIKPGCVVWLTPPPFDHSKLMVVDGCWSLIGSANWDQRSLRLNFELDVEVYDVDLARTLETGIAERKRPARRVTLEELDGRPLPTKLRDGVARLFQPVL